MPKPKKPQAEVKEVKFRAQYKEYGLTYSRCPIEREDLVERLTKILDKYNLSMENYYVARETHKKPVEEGKYNTPYHLHIWFNLTTKPNFKNFAVFDIISPKEEFDWSWHPNIGRKKKNWIYNYLKKQDKTPFTDIQSGYVELAIAGDTKSAIALFAEQHPKEYVINLDRVTASIHKLSRKKPEMKIWPFTGDVIEIPEGQSLLIVGASNIGKTEWAKSYITHHLKKTFLFVTHLDKLKKYNGEDVLLYDDVDFHHLPRTTQIHIAEVGNPRDIHCRHTVASIPAGILNIFCANHDPFLMSDPAISRRLFRAPTIRFY